MRRGGRFGLVPLAALFDSTRGPPAVFLIRAFEVAGRAHDNIIAADHRERRRYILANRRMD